MNNIKRKYEFTGAVRKLSNGIIVKKIRRLSDGLLGGWIESEENLSHYGTCFVYNEAVVYGCSKITDDAKIFNNAVIRNSHIQNNAVVKHTAEVFDCIIGENAEINGYGRIIRCEICNTIIDKSYFIFGSSINTFPVTAINILGNKYVRITNCEIANFVGKDIVIENGCLENAIITFDPKECDYISIQEHNTRLVTYYRPKKGGPIRANVGCQRNLSLDKFKERIFNEYGGIKNNPHRVIYLNQMKNIEGLLNKKVSEEEIKELEAKWLIKGRD